MALTTFGSAETLLGLLARYQGLNGRRANPFEVWSRIAQYVRDGGTYRFYPYAVENLDAPAPEFVDDLAGLVADGYLRPLPSGDLEVTPGGTLYASALALPNSVQPLLSELTDESHNQRARV
ncbi:MAG: hypothetical protein DYH08_09285 [Actinobacteria bacterium ATB1]|nr:hypothetical protein [Actinobacteria bacterium ATB1]